MIGAIGVWVTGYLFPWICGFLVFGIIVQVIDLYMVKYETARLVPSYRKWYNRSRPPEDHLPEGTMGWFYNQPFPRRHNRALVISGIQSLVSVYYGANALAEFAAFLVEGWTLLPGLWLGTFAFSLLTRQDEFIQRAEGVRKQMVGRTLSGILSEGFSSIANWRVPASRSSDPVAPVAPAPKAIAEEPVQSGRARFRDAMNRKPGASDERA
jgi:hypothetical protein